MNPIAPSAEPSHGRTTRRGTTWCSRFRVFPGSPSRPLGALLPPVTFGPPSTASKSCRSRLRFALCELPVLLPIAHNVKATILRGSSHRGQRRNLLVLVTFVVVSAYTLNAQDLAFRIGEYMNAQVETN